LTQTGDEVLVQFDESGTSDIDRYEVWSSVGTTTDWNLVGLVKSDDIATTMSIVDDTFNKNATIYYKVYPIKTGVYGSPISSSVVVSGTIADVTNMNVDQSVEGYWITYDLPDDNRLLNITIKKDAATTLGGLNEGSATTIYTGLDESYFYLVPEADADKYHQFWIYSNVRT
jgi:hypothetical protein